MQVNANPNVSATTKMNGQRPPPPTARVDKAVFLETDALNQSLQQVPDVRQDAVDRARTLVQDSQYPPLSVLQDIAALLSEHL